MLGLGTEAPDFRLPDTTAGGKEVALSDFEAAPALLVVFLCNHCPFVQHVAGELAALSRDLPARGGAMVGISSNDVAAYPADRPEAMAADGARRLVYRGQLDASRPGNGLPVTGTDLRAAVDAVLAGHPVDPDQRPSLGCNIKWKPGNEPAAVPSGVPHRGDSAV